MSNITALHGKIFTEHKSPFGWYFSAEEEARAWEVCQISEQWFNKHYAPISDDRIVLTQYANSEKKLNPLLLNYEQ